MADLDEEYPVDETGDARMDEADETDFATIAEGDTIEAAKQKALDQLRKVVPYVNEADVDFQVMEEAARGGFFGRGKTVARVEARLRPTDERVDGDLPDGDLPEGAQTLREFIQDVVGLMGIEARVTAEETPERVKANISGDDLGLLIGRHGATIDAIQYLSAIVVNGDRRERRQVVVDAEGYRERREVALKALADRTAQKVDREGVSVALQPMTAGERKVIHLYLKDDGRVETASEGNEPYRAVVVSPPDLGD